MGSVFTYLVVASSTGSPEMGEELEVEELEVEEKDGGCRLEENEGEWGVRFLQTANEYRSA
jgi:hypothetical protein